MNILVLTGTIYPFIGNNVNLLGKLLPFLQKKNVHITFFSKTDCDDKSVLPLTFNNLPVFWMLDDRKGFKRSLVYPAVAKIKDPNGFSDYIQVQILSDKLKEILKQNKFDAIIATSEPFPMAVTASELRNVKKVLYLMDPPALVSNGRNTKYRSSSLKKTLNNQDIIISTPFIFKALKQHGIELNDVNCIEAGFPMIEDHGFSSNTTGEDKFKLLFTGWLYSDIRSPEYFLNIVSHLDERFQITFMGRECEKLKERYLIESKAEIITSPQQPYELALQAMADADVLINIGNSVQVHMPSKTLEYINTGKPIVNFYKLEDCPTLYYTKRYPLALNLSENNPDIDTVAAKFIRFCESTKGQVVDRKYILDEYKDCTPEYIANKILEALEKQTV